MQGACMTGVMNSMSFDESDIANKAKSHNRAGSSIGAVRTKNKSESASFSSNVHSPSLVKKLDSKVTSNSNQ
jgi:hypothetical protein